MAARAAARLLRQQDSHCGGVPGLQLCRKLGRLKQHTHPIPIWKTGRILVCKLLSAMFTVVQSDLLRL
jgi:hypothetical protein